MYIIFNITWIVVCRAGLGRQCVVWSDGVSSSPAVHHTHHHPQALHFTSDSSVRHNQGRSYNGELLLTGDGKC